MKKSTTFAAIALSIGLLTSSAAYADCEADLNSLEQAMAAPSLSPDLKAEMTKAGEAGAAALRKDDDATCHTVVMDVLAKAGVNTDAAKPANSGKPLGDLTAFKTITEDTLKLVTDGKLPEAKARIKDLETAWDAAAAKLQAQNKGEWTAIDSAIDKSLKELRAGTPTVAASTEALNALLKVINESK